MTNNLYKTLKTKLLFIAIFLSISLQPVLAAGTGTLKGKVLDKETKGALTGANMIIKGTSLGAATDLDGNYLIRNIPAGQITLEISYIGYSTIDVPLKISENETLQKDFYLEPTSLTGKTVVVTAQAQGQLSAINQQLSSDKIVNVVSSEKMQELPDANIAESVGRLPGISVTRNAGEANAVVIRGLSPKYNEITIEGVPMSSTNYYDRGVDLSLLSDNLVKGVEVSKTLTPDMDADALGGTVNFTLRTADPGLHYNLWGNGGYSNLRNSYNNYKFSGTISDRFFNDKFGILAQGNIEEKQLPSDQLNAAYASPTFNSQNNSFYINTQSASLTESNIRRGRYGASVILDYTSSWVDLKFYNVYDRKNDSTLSRVNTTNFTSNSFEDDIYINETTTEQRTHSLQALFKFAGTELPASISFTRSDQRTPNGQEFVFLQTNISHTPASALIYGAPSTLISSYTHVMDPTNQNTTLYNMFVNNTSLTDQSWDGKLDWKIPFRFSDNLSGLFKVGGRFQYTNRVSANIQNYDYLLYGAGAGNRADLINTFPYLKGDLNSSQGIGAIPFVDHSYNRTNILGYEIGPSYNIYQLANMQNYYYYTLNRTTNRYWTSGPNDFNQNYSYYERDYAGYIMGTFNIGSDLTIVPGIRYQEMNTDISAYQIRVNVNNQNGLDGNPPKLIDSRTDNPGWFPSVNIKYKANDHVQFMGAAYRSVSLPSYGDITPMVELQDGTTIVSGNPLLRPSTAWNFDLSTSLFSNDIGLFTVDLFYKEISDLIYGMQNYYPFSPYSMRGAPSDISSRLPGRNYYDTTWVTTPSRRLTGATVPMNDPSMAYLRGIELSWQTHLWYLPGVLSGIVLDLNVSYMSSNQMYPSFKIVGPLIGNKDTMVYSTTEGSLQDQPSAIYNAILGWDYKGFSARFSLQYQKKTLTNIDTRYGLENSYYDNVFLIDVSLKQQIFDGLSVFANATNINSHIDNYYFSHPTYTTTSATYAGGQLPTSGQTYGWDAQFGISYNY